MRRSALALATGALVLAGLQPATAAVTPAPVGLVSFVASSYSRSQDTTGFTLDWPVASGARSYEVFMSRSYEMTRAKKLTASSSQITVKGLPPGRDHFFQVRAINGKKVGTKSARVGHTTTVEPGPTGSTLAVRVMTYNVCSQVCDDKQTTRYPWVQTADTDPSPRQPPALDRVAAASPDILATQEAGEMATPPGYTLARYISAKRLFYKTSRFVLATPTTDEPPLPPKDPDGCRPTSAYDQPSGHIFLGHHDGGCRYAVWARLAERATGKQVLAVDAHLVRGDDTDEVANADRAAEVRTLHYATKKINTAGLPVILAGDFNSHKNRTPDVVAPIMRWQGYRDAYDLARTLDGQHFNSFNRFRTSPVIGYKWGDHVDHVWVDPGRARVDAWRNGVLIEDGRLVKPIPSDHSPIIVDLRLR